MTVATPTAAPTSSVSCACKIFRAFNSDPPAENGSADWLGGLGALGAVLAALFDEGLEQALVLADLGVPEDAQREAALRVLERLERAVVRPCRLAEAPAELPEALVVVRLDRRVVAEQRLEPRARLERHVVVGVLTRRVLVLVVADEVGKMLDEVAAEADVQHLAPTADGQQWHVAFECPVQERQLGTVALLEHPVRLRVRIVTVRRRVQVGAAREHDRIEQVEGLLGACLARGISTGRPPARSTART